MERLPPAVERLIYEMDPTYHRIAWQRVCREIRGELPNYDLVVLCAALLLVVYPRGSPDSDT